MTIKEFFESKEKLAIHCDTEEKAKKLLKVFDKVCRCWANGESYAKYTNWEIYEEATCYSNNGYYGRIGYFKEFYNIIEFDEIELEVEEKGGEWRECCRLKIPSCEDRSTIVAILNAAGYKTHIEDNGKKCFDKEYYVVVEEKI